MSLYTDQVLFDAPRGYARLGESSGLVMSDSSGNGFTGVYAASGVTLAQAGAIGNDTNTAATFDGTAGYAAFGAGLDTTGYTALSIECWFNFASGLNRDGRLVNNSHTDANNQGFQLVLNTGAKSGFFSIGVGASQHSIFYGLASILPNVWYQYGATWDGNNYSVYLNGAQVTTGGATGTLASSGLSINIGRGAYNNDYCQTSIDEVSIYNTALSATRFNQHYLAAMESVFQTGTIRDGKVAATIRNGLITTKVR
jgi:hypothetical protein